MSALDFGAETGERCQGPVGFESPDLKALVLTGVAGHPHSCRMAHLSSFPYIKVLVGIQRRNPHLPTHQCCDQISTQAWDVKGSEEFE